LRITHQKALRREATAYHEAGHAVIAYVLGYKPKSVTIVPTHDANGSVAYPLHGIALDSDGSDRAHLRLEIPIQISYAGLLAQRKHSEHSWPDFHAEWDYKQITDLGLRACGSA
jgi:hypothetical protein